MPLTDEVHPSAVLAWVEGARLADALLQQHPFMQFSRSFLFTALRAFPGRTPSTMPEARRIHRTVMSTDLPMKARFVLHFRSSWTWKYRCQALSLLSF